MQAYKQLPFILKSILVGLAAAAIILLIQAFIGVQNNSSRGKFNDQFSFVNAINQASPAVVNIYASKVFEQQINPLFRDPLFQRFFGSPEPPPNRRRDSNLGSGVIMKSQGYILTNAHVIKNKNEISVTLVDGRQYTAEVIGIDSATDLAVLRISIEGLPVIPIGNSSNVNVGDIVLAIGNPFDFGQTVTQGIVSATGRNRMGITTYENFIQTDADINPGNSGGALINVHGELIGINTAIISSTGGSQGIGLATPVNQAVEVMEQVIKHGRVVRGWLGIEAQVLPADTLKETGLKNYGILVAGVLNNGPADRAGIQPGDIIVNIGEQPVNNPQHAINTISHLKPGSTIDIKILRGWDQLVLQARIAERPPFEENSARN